MPQISLGDGTFVEVPEALVGRSEIRLPITTVEGVRWTTFSLCADGQYRALLVRERPRTRYPHFNGWDQVNVNQITEHSKGTFVFVSIDRDSNDYLRYPDPETSLNNGGKICLAWGRPCVSEAWAVYRKIDRPSGNIRLMLSRHFSEPLPLP